MSDRVPAKGKDHMFYGRRLGRPLKKGNKKAVEHILPLLQFSKETPQKDIKAFAQKAADHQKSLWLEIGFGAGEHFVELAKSYPDHYFIGCEPFINGVALCLKNLNQTLTPDDYQRRVRIWDDSAETLLAHIPDQSLERLYLLNPDPWPKKRHHKRRFVRSDNLEQIARILKPDGLFITATDVGELAEWMLEKTMQHGAFEWQAFSQKDWSRRPADWMITTRYAAKGAEAGRTEIYLRFKKK